PGSGIDTLNILPGPEVSELFSFNPPVSDDVSGSTLLDLFHDSVVRGGSSVALVYGGVEMSYQELDLRSNRVARHLQGLGVLPGMLVPICVERSFEMVVGILGILKSGGAYVPIDPSYPVDRISYMLDDVSPSVIVSMSGCLDSFAGLCFDGRLLLNLDESEGLISLDEGQPLGFGPDPFDLAYVIYTSGSTGRPKGVMVEHLSILNRLSWSREHYGIGAEDVFVQKTNFCFDVSVWEILIPLISGGRLVILEPGGHKDNGYIREIIRGWGVNNIHFVPSAFETFLDGLGAGDCPGLKRVFCSGEELKRSQVAFFGEKLPFAELHNLYGPTEAAVDVTYWSWDGQPVNSSVPIGSPIPNTLIYIVDSCMRLVPVGVPGEICIGGVQVARGYLNLDELSSERFIPDPFSGTGRLYLTGDLGRWLPDGNIDFLGRLDNQVKVRGYRIELGEIESVLGESSFVSQSVVVSRTWGDGPPQLIGYIVPSGAYDVDGIRAFLLNVLPDYMVPSFFVELAELPLTASGKVDRGLLPEPDLSLLRSLEYVGPDGEVEERLCLIWSSLLNIEKIGTGDNFFDLGGNSLLAIRLVSAIRKEYKIEL
ncbi:amino acid adenylation domain-containing protein, partial [Pedobacter jeongneungensis]|uniref:non-ribosomal peptide synthetase n=1 Tax=Pedobacter jeongneungensis TaxID=947309 RepID=UPI0031ED2B4E